MGTIPVSRLRFRPHFFLTCFDWILLLCNFFRKIGNVVAGFLAMRLSFFAITLLLSS
jgi:hypothetical protein